MLTSLSLASLRLIWNSSMALCTLLWFSKCISTLGKSDPHSERSSCIFKRERNTFEYCTHLSNATVHYIQTNGNDSPASPPPSSGGPEQISCWPPLLSCWGPPVRISVRACGSACVSNAWGCLGPCRHHSPCSSGLKKAADRGSRQGSRTGWGTV